MAAETFINVGESTLSVAATNVAATFTLASGAPFNVAGQYRLRLDDSLQQSNGVATRYEICRATFNAGNVVNAFRSGGDLEGTTAQAWPIGTKVVAIVTAAGLANFRFGGGLPLQIQAGTQHFTAFINGEIDQVISITTAWPTAHVSFLAMVWPAANWTCWAKGAKSASLSQGTVHIYNSTPQDLDVFWISVGY